MMMMHAGKLRTQDGCIKSKSIVHLLVAQKSRNMFLDLALICVFIHSFIHLTFNESLAYLLRGSTADKVMNKWKHYCPHFTYNQVT